MTLLLDSVEQEKLIQILVICKKKFDTIKQITKKNKLLKLPMTGFQQL